MSRRARLVIFVPTIAVFGALLFWSYAGIPDFGHYKHAYGRLVLRVATPERHMANATNAVTYDYRGFDTMGEEFILFASVVGVVLLLRSGGERKRDMDESVGSDLVRVVGVLAVSAAVLVGLWLVAFGFVTPGGGFQGGVVIAGGAVLLFLAASYRAWSGFGDEHILDPLEGIGAGGYVIVGLAALVSGLPFLRNLLGGGTTGTVWSAGSAAFVNWAAGIEVAAANLVLYTEYLHEYVVPLGRK